MVFVEICVGSACHIKGSQDIVELMQSAIVENRLEDDVVLSGSFCTGRCNRDGVTITVNDAVYVGITRESFRDFFADKILKAAKEGA